MNSLLLMIGLALMVDEWQPIHAVDVAPDGITELKAGFGSTLATARIRTVKLENGAENGGERNRGFHCSGGRNPCSPVLELEFEVDGKYVLVPASVFADLADVNTAELRQTGEVVTLFLSCGDAASSYSAMIEFDAIRVRKREIISGFGTNEVAEETTYHELAPLD
ncbi:MAG: hypothetical protein ACREO3_12615 [Arenimonas sp.]